MARDKQQAAQMRASHIRTLHMLHQRLGSVMDDYKRVEQMHKWIDDQLESMGAETIAAQKERMQEFWDQRDHTDQAYKRAQKPFGGAKKYKITYLDVLRYNSW